MIASLLLSTTVACPAPATPAPPRVAGAVAQDDVVDDLIARGQRLLWDGNAVEALPLFQQADGHTGGAFRTQQWVLRAMMETGRLNDATDVVDRLANDGVDHPGVDYLYGVSSYLRAQEHLRAGTRSGNVGFHFEDAKAFLGKALAEAPDAYPDGWVLLMDAARSLGDNETAAEAADQALRLLPDAPPVLSLAAKVDVARGVELLRSSDEAERERGRALVEQGVARATAAASGFGEDPEEAAAITDAHLQRAVGSLWLEDRGAAADAYAAALGWDPTQVDFGSLWSTFWSEEEGAATFVDVLQRGSDAFRARWGEDTASDAGLEWWLGYGLYSQKKYAAAEPHFVRAVEKFPSYLNAHWYAGMCRYHTQDYDGAVEAWKANFDADPANVAASVNQDPEFHQRILAYVEGKMMEAGRPDRAAAVAEVRVAASPEDDRAWNNLGLFCRDAGDMLRRLGEPDAERAERIARYYERAWEAYARAMELAPGKPYYLNDAAVILHYCLDRDLDRAARMYREAREIAERMLDQGGLSDDERGLVEIALRDSKNNLAALERLVERREEERRRREAEEEQEGDGDGEGDGGTEGDGDGS